MELCILVQLQFLMERWIVVELWFTVKLLGFGGALDRSRTWIVVEL